MISRTENKKESIAHCLLACACVYLSGHSYAIVASSVVAVFFIAVGFAACILLGSSRLEIPQKINVEGIFIGSIVTGALLSYVLYSGRNMWLDPIILISRISLAYLITQRISFEDYAKRFGSLMTVLTIAAIIVYVLAQIGIQIPSYSYTNLIGIKNHTIWITSWTDISAGHGNIRLSGPFWEPGLYASMAIYGLLCEGCFSKRKPRKYVIVTLFIGILLSQSTAGYILAFLVITMIWLLRMKYKRATNIIILIAFLILYIFSDRIIERLYALNPDIFGKLVEQNVSANTRVFSTVACLRIFAQEPLTGLGMSYAIDQYNLYKPILGIDALTSTSGFMLAAFGIWGISYTLFLCRGVFRQRRFPLSIRILLFLVLISIVNKEPHTSIIFTYILMFYLNKGGPEKTYALH